MYYIETCGKKKLLRKKHNSFVADPVLGIRAVLQSQFYTPSFFQLILSECMI
jgi:hypothetical protein